MSAQPRLGNMSTPQIVAAIEALHVEYEARYQEICVYLSELAARGERHPLHDDMLFKHFEAVANGKLLPGVVTVSAGNPRKLARFIRQKQNVQLRIANQRDFVVAKRRPDGTIREAKACTEKMTIAEIERVFTESGEVATFTEQRRELEATAPKPTKPAPPLIRADPDKRCVVVGSVELTIDKLQSVLSEIGFKVTPTKAKGRTL